MNHHAFWWRFLPRKELNQVYVSTVIWYLSVSLIGIFIPLYLMRELGYSLVHTLNFFVFYSILFAVATPVAAKFSEKFGPKHSVLVSIPLYLSALGLLYVLSSINLSPYLVGGIFGASQGFYWIGMHLIFHHASDRKHRGSEMGKKLSLSISASVVGPLVGGLLITIVGFWLVFMLVAVLMIFSGIVLFSSKDRIVNFSFSIRRVLNLEDWRDSLYFISQGTQVMSNGVIWPLFIFIILGSYFSLGIVGSLIAGLSALLMLVAGKVSDKYSKRRIIRWISGFEFLAWILKAFVQVPLQVYAASTFGAVTTGIRESPLGALTYNKAKKDIASYFVKREIFICLGRILILEIVILTNSLSGGLIFQGFASLAALLF
jgi:MFS transporter, DHA1 family, inner membrane transport protein